MKSNLKIVIASSTLLLSGAVCAMDFDPKFYVGADLDSNYLATENTQTVTLQNTQFSIVRSSKKTEPSLSGFLGVRLIENMGVELGHTAFKAFKDQSSLAIINGQLERLYSSITLRSAYIDVLGFLPVATDCDLIASLGAGTLVGSKWKLSTLTGASIEPKMSANTLRLGLGAQYKFHDNFVARAMLRYQQFNNLKLANVASTTWKMHIGSAGLGLFYQF
ncbi:MAG: outer membrane beta-barrel protein [Gammaproteobacteria bacterium]|nr:outer membrane beta-barrel protein [Gammaproteobacteria bacterium]MBP9729751.1 outer membrane beta-barrel protein [Gammaproteobacteria bacterium]